MIVGSTAVKFHIPSARNPRDLDVWMRGNSEDNFEKFNCKIERWDASSYPALNKVLDKYNDPEYAPLYLLFTIKLSHSFFDLLSFEKTLHDIDFLQKNGVNYIDSESFMWLYDLWTEIHGKKRCNLNKPNNEFFTKSVSRAYCHDFIHECVKYYDEPMFQKIKKDRNLALTSWKMFDNLTERDKLRTCMEEIYVLALERFLIPSDFKVPSLVAYRKSLKILITSAWRGQWATYLVLNYQKLKNPEVDYVELFKTNSNK